MVVDASVWVSRLLPADSHHAASRAWLARHLLAGGLLVCPSLLLAEVAGAVSRRTGRPRLARRAIETLLRLPGLRMVALDHALARAAGAAAASLGLRGADAVYVATAHRLDLPLVTWDSEQRLRATRLVAVRTPE